MKPEDVIKVQNFCRRKNQEMQEPSAHTPGPWVVCQTKETGWRIQAGSKIICWQNIPGREKIEKQKFDASLISAAPDLLAAAKHALEALTDPENIDPQDAIDVLEAAIDKATRN